MFFLAITAKSRGDNRRKVYLPKMSAQNDSPANNELAYDEFLAWYGSLSVEVQREVLITISEENDLGGIAVRELISDASLHIAPSINTILLLN